MSYYNLRRDNVFAIIWYRQWHFAVGISMILTRGHTNVPEHYLCSGMFSTPSHVKNHLLKQAKVKIKSVRSLLFTMGSVIVVSPFFPCSSFSYGGTLGLQWHFVHPRLYISPSFGTLGSIAHCFYAPPIAPCLFGHASFGTSVLSIVGL